MGTENMEILKVVIADDEEEIRKSMIKKIE